MSHFFFSVRMNCQPKPLHRQIFEICCISNDKALDIFVCDSFIKMISMQWVKRSKANHMPIIRLLAVVRQLVAYGNSIEFSSKSETFSFIIHWAMKLSRDLCDKNIYFTVNEQPLGPFIYQQVYWMCLSHDFKGKKQQKLHQTWMADVKIIC